MFIEPHNGLSNRGWVEVICGSMFSGKTEELIRRLKRARIAHQRVEIFKPSLDVRYSSDHLVSHDDNMIRSTAVHHSNEILILSENVQVVGIDEAQFFDDGIMNVCQILALKGVRVIVAGLDMDYTGKPFGQMPNLLAIADYITKLHAICMVCGQIANYSFRKSASAEQVMLGEKDLYEPRCRICFQQQEAT